MIKEQLILIYQNELKVEPFIDWLENLTDQNARGLIKARINRIQLGNFGDCKSLGNGVFEMRIHYSPGYRIYFSRENERTILLLCGGNKKTQKRDIALAKFL